MPAARNSCCPSLRLATWGMKPWPIWLQLGCSKNISTAKHPPTRATRAITRASSRRIPKRCSASSSSVSAAVRPTPQGKGQAEEQLQGNGAAYQLGQVAGNDRHFGQQPEGDPPEPRQQTAAGLGQIQPRRDAQAAAERLEHHRHQAGEPDHPQQAVAELGAGRQIRGPIARIHVAHCHQVAGAQHPQKGAHRAQAGRNVHHLGVDAGGRAQRCIRHEATPAELEGKARVAAILLGHGWHEPTLGKGSPPAQKSRAPV